MTVEVNVVGMRCGAKNGGLSCSYCYEIPLRQANAPIPPLDLAAVTRALDHYGEAFSLFGGEPLLAPIETLEALWRVGFEKYGRNGIQTSGRPITEEHFELFRKYNVSVSFSIDGPHSLNGARVAGDASQTLYATSRSIAALERCLEMGLNTGLIVTLSAYNFRDDLRLEQMMEWFRRLDSLGLQEVGLHVLEHDGAAAAIALPDERAFRVLVDLFFFQETLERLRFPLFRDVQALLRGEDAWKWNDGTAGGVSCIWAGCDPFTTPAVQGIDPDGKRTLCPRVHKGPIAWGAAPRGPLVRLLTLRNTPQEQGGCQGCRQIITCKGSCPGTAEGGNWRRRTRDCSVWQRLFEFFEAELLRQGVQPVTLRADRQEIERRMAAHWSVGRATSIAAVLREMAEGREPAGASEGYSHGDHSDHGDHVDVSALLEGVHGEAVIER